MRGEDALFAAVMILLAVAYYLYVNRKTEVQVEVKVVTPWAEDEPKPVVKAKVIDKPKQFTSAKEVGRWLDDRTPLQKMADCVLRRKK